MSTEQLVVIAFATVQAAMDAAPTGGGTVICPGGSYAQPGTLYWPCDRCVNVTGETPANGRNSQGVTFTFSTTADMARIRGNGSTLRNVVLVGPGGAAGAEETGRGITVGRRGVVADPYNNTNPLLPGTNTEVQNGAGGATDVCRDVVIEDVVVKNAPGWGLFIGGFRKLSDGATDESNAVASVTLSIFVTCHRLSVVNSKKYGGVFVGGGCTTCHFNDCTFLGLGKDQAPVRSFYAWTVAGEGVIFDHCTFEGQCPATNEWVRVGGFHNTFRDCWWEEDNGETSPHTPQWFLNVGPTTGGAFSGNISILTPTFRRNVNTDGKPRFMQVTPSVRGLTLENPNGQVSVNPVSGGSFIEAAIDLGGNSNSNFSIIGAGLLIYAGTPYDMVYSNVPGESFIVHHRVIKVPQMSDAAKIDPLQQVSGAGTLGMNWDLSGLGGAHSVGCLEYYWGGSNGGWRLVNNAPRMTRAERDGRTAANWQIGDVIWVTDAPAGRELQVRISGSAWAWLSRTTDIAGD